MNDARGEITAALAASGTDEPEPEVALRVLGLAFRWAGAELGTVDGGASGTDALAALYALDDALQDGQELAGALPALLAAALPGEQVGRAMEDQMRRLSEATEQVNGARATLEKLAAREETLRERLAQHEALRRQVDELRRLERLVLALDALKEQQQVIADRLAALRGRGTGVDEALRTSGDALIRLTDDQLGVLAPRTRQVLERAAAAQGELATEERRHAESTMELAASEERLAQLRQTVGVQVASLRLHATFDRELAQALGALEGAPPAAAGTGTETSPPQRLSLADVAAVTAEIERRLHAADDALGRVLAEREAENHQGRGVFPRTG